MTYLITNGLTWDFWLAMAAMEWVLFRMMGE